MASSPVPRPIAKDVHRAARARKPQLKKRVVAKKDGRYLIYYEPR